MHPRLAFTRLRVLHLDGPVRTELIRRWSPFRVVPATLTIVAGTFLWLFGFERAWIAVLLASGLIAHALLTRNQPRPNVGLGLDMFLSFLVLELVSAPLPAFAMAYLAYAVAATLICKRTPRVALVVFLSALFALTTFLDLGNGPVDPAWNQVVGFVAAAVFVLLLLGMIFMTIDLLMSADEPTVGTQGDSPSTTPRRRGWVPAARTFGTVLLVAVAATLWARQAVDRDVDDRLALQSELFVAAIQNGIENIELRMAALEGLFLASETVTPDEFAGFVDGLDVDAGVGGMAYMPIVTASDLSGFQQRVADLIPGYEVFEIDPDGNRVSVGDRDVYFPVQYFAPSDSLERPLGLDAGSPPGRLSYLMKTVDTGETVATPLLASATTDQEGLLFFRPVRDAAGSIDALVAVPVIFDSLIAEQVPERLAGVLDWTIRDVTDQTTGVPPDSGSLDPRDPILPPSGDGMVHTDFLAVADRIWQFDVTPAAGSPLLYMRLEPYAILLGGLVVAILAGASAYSYSRRQEAATELEAMREVLETKDQFVATVSHKLRTPLTGVLGFADLLHNDNGQISADERAEIVATIAEQASDVARTINDLLVIGRDEHGTLTVVTVPVDVRAQTTQVLKNIQLTDRIHVESTQGVTTALADPGRVRQIIRNLITNAAAYGGPNIQVTIKAFEEQLAVEVTDDGTGIPAEHADKIFDPYYRAHTTTGTPGSMGLGLAVSRTLARRMGGDLTLHQTSSQTNFRLTLPTPPQNNPENGLFGNERVLGS